MSRNQFDLLGDDTLVADYEKQKNNNIRKSSLLFRSGEVKTKQARKSHTLFEIIYDIEYLWFVVLEFLPLRDLFRCSMVNKFTCGLVHSFNCYGEILKRDFFSKNQIDMKPLVDIVKNLDNTGVFVYLTQDYCKAKFTSQKLGSIKHTVTQVIDSKYKKIFGKIYMAIETEVEEKKLEADALKQHVRKFLIEKIRSKTIQNMRTKVRECAHNHCEISEIDSHPFTFRLECLDCKLAALTNFRPESVFKKETLVRYSRYAYLRTPLINLEKYVLKEAVHVFEFERATLYY